MAGRTGGWAAVLFLSTATLYATDPCTSDQRAGRPRSISIFARPAVEPAFDGYYVGGSKAFGGVGREPNQGVWGWDFLGRKPVKRVVLNWPGPRPEPSPQKRERLLDRNGGYRSDAPELTVPGPLKKF